MNPDNSRASQEATTRPLPDPDATAPPSAEFDGALEGSQNPSDAQTNIAPPGYEVVGELGRGGMGVVYKSRQINASRIVALKMILAGGHSDRDSRARFRTEAEAIARLSHPGIVQVFEVGEHQGLPFFSLEFCSGGSLDRKLAGTPLPDREAATLVKALAEAMDVAHRAGVIHRDLKPANVLIDANGLPKVTDFGLAKKLDEDGGTRTGSVMGTASYMAPEQANGETKQLGPACDVYALGAILYECLTGRPPFKGFSVLDTLQQVLADEPVPPSHLSRRVSRDLETVCLKCLMKGPAMRYASAAALADDLRRFLDREPIAARPPGLFAWFALWVRRRERVRDAGAFSIFLAIVLSTWNLIRVGLIAWGRLEVPDPESAAIQLGAMIGVFYVPMGLIGWACLRGKVAALWAGAAVAGYFLYFGIRCIADADRVPSYISTGGMHRNPQVMYSVFSLLSVLAAVQCLAYLTAIFAHRAERRPKYRLPVQGTDQ